MLFNSVNMNRAVDDVVQPNNLLYKIKFKQKVMLPLEITRGTIPHGCFPFPSEITCSGAALVNHSAHAPSYRHTPGWPHR